MKLETASRRSHEGVQDKLLDSEVNVRVGKAPNQTPSRVVIDKGLRDAAKYEDIYLSAPALLMLVQAVHVASTADVNRQRPIKVARQNDTNLCQFKSCGLQTIGRTHIEDKNYAGVPDDVHVDRACKSRKCGFMIL